MSQKTCLGSWALKQYRQIRVQCKRTESCCRGCLGGGVGEVRRPNSAPVVRRTVGQLVSLFGEGEGAQQEVTASPKQFNIATVSHQILWSVYRAWTANNRDAFIQLWVPW